MKTWKITAIAGALLLAGLGGVMATNNPDQTAYETFATQALVDYTEQNLCKKIPLDWGSPMQIAAGFKQV
ncbi:DUF4359 domain-containing protein [Kovacikia minuta]|uniref:DUF4359 domain-containing protein n=1 Tax=Kovacikia minuta TaxID=2931930 RepID=UPI0020C782C9|nr:DUF4359 domain-containing protein [Kovacikia minuta]